MGQTKRKIVEDSALEDAFGSPLVPDAVKRAFKFALDSASDEQLLWRLVAARAVLDAVGNTGYGPSSHRKHVAAIIDAQRWFRESWDDVREVFDFAGVPIDGVREIMAEFHLDEHDRVVRISASKLGRVVREVHQAERSRAGAC